MYYTSQCQPSHCGWTEQAKTLPLPLHFRHFNGFKLAENGLNDFSECAPALYLETDYIFFQINSAGDKGTKGNRLC